MPRFLTLVRIDERNAPTDAPGPEFDERMGALFEEISKAGVMLDTAGLAPTAEGTRITWSGGKFSYTDGPFTESKEVIGVTPSPGARTRPRRWSGPSGSWRSTRSTGRSPSRSARSPKADGARTRPETRPDRGRDLIGDGT